MNTNQAYYSTAIFIIFGWMTPYASRADNFNQDVNLTPLYIGSKTQKDSDLRGEIILQLPFPLSESFSKNGSGLFGGLLYLDANTFVNIEKDSASTMGIGRIYYSYNVSENPSHTFIPFLTLYRELHIELNNSGDTTEQKGWLLPGFMYAYRVNESTVLHFDSEIYSYNETNNYRVKAGISYDFDQQWVVSIVHESLSWDIVNSVGSSDVFMRGNSKENYFKLIYRNPAKWNISIIAGYGVLRNTAAPLLAEQSMIDNMGPIFGVEVSAGNLAW